MPEVETNFKQPKQKLTRREEQAIREEIYQRDRVCQLAGVRGAGPCFGGPTFQHKRKASQGGEFSVENGALLCCGHNTRIEAEADLAALAHSLGLVVKAGDG